jgi:hypothetical protein
MPKIESPLTIRLRAEEQFTASQKKAKQAQADIEKERQERTSHIAELKALRLAKEAAERQVAEKAPKKPAAKKSTAASLPQVHRQNS